MTTRRTSGFATFATFATTAAASVMMAGLTLGSVASPYQAPPVAAGSKVVHQLPRVVVTGQVERGQLAKVVELPRVVVTGRRVGTASTLVVNRDTVKDALRT